MGLLEHESESRYSPYPSLPGEDVENVQFCLRGPRCYENMGKEEVKSDEGNLKTLEDNEDNDLHWTLKHGKSLLS